MIYTSGGLRCRDLQSIIYSFSVCPQEPENAVVQVEIFFLSPPVEGSQATFLKAPGGGHTTKGTNKEVGDAPSGTYFTSPIFSGLGALLQESLRQLSKPAIPLAWSSWRQPAEPWTTHGSMSCGCLQERRLRCPAAERTLRGRCFTFLCWNWRGHLWLLSGFQAVDCGVEPAQALPHACQI